MLDVKSPDTDEYLLGQITDVCRWYAGGPPSSQRQSTALTELAHLAAERPDLLARYAGQTLASHDTGPDAPACERAVHLCITAGADMTLIDHWSHESRPRGTTRPGQRP
jgi:hypothetical protein